MFACTDAAACLCVCVHACAPRRQAVESKLSLQQVHEQVHARMAMRAALRAAGLHRWRERGSMQQHPYWAADSGAAQLIQFVPLKLF